MSVGRLFCDIWSTSDSYYISLQVQFSRQQQQTEPRLIRLDKQYRSTKCAEKPSDYLMIYRNPRLVTVVMLRIRSLLYLK